MNIIHYGQYRTKHTLRGADHKNFWRCSMDTALLVTILVLAVIAAVEMLCLFLCSKLRTNVSSSELQSTLFNEFSIKKEP